MRRILTFCVQQFAYLIKGILEHKEYILAAVNKAVIQSLFPFAFDTTCSEVIFLK